VAEFIKKVFVRYAEDLLVTQELAAEEALVCLFRVAHEGLTGVHDLAQFSGSTAAAAIVDGRSGIVTTAHAGDTRILVLEDSAVVFETRDHSISAEDIARIIASGGEVREVSQSGIKADRIFVRGTDYPGLAMSRSLGDLEAQRVGATPEPEICRGIPFGPRNVLLIASDGIWEKMTSGEVQACMVPDALGHLVANIEQDLQQAATSLVEHSATKWSGPDVDDITAVMLRMAPTPGEISVLDISNAAEPESFVVNSDSSPLDKGFRDPDRDFQEVGASAELEKVLTTAEAVAIEAEVHQPEAASAVCSFAESVLVAKGAAPAPEATPEMPYEELRADSQLQEIPPEVLPPALPEAALALPEVELEAASTFETGPRTLNSEETQGQLWEIFQKLDLNGAGSINKRELIKVCRTDAKIANFLGLPTQIRQEDGSRDLMERFFQALDKSQEREISWEEFQDVHKVIKKQPTAAIKKETKMLKGASALLKGLKSGEVGRLVDSMQEPPPSLDNVAESTSEKAMHLVEQVNELIGYQDPAGTQSTLAAAAVAAMGQPQVAPLAVIPSPAAADEVGAANSRSWRDLTPTGSGRSLLAPQSFSEEFPGGAAASMSTLGSVDAAPKLSLGGASCPSLAAVALANVPSTPSLTSVASAPVIPAIVPEARRLEATSNCPPVVKTKPGSWQEVVDSSSVRRPSWSVSSQPAAWGGPPPTPPQAAWQGVRQAPSAAPFDEPSQRRWVIGTDAEATASEDALLKQGRSTDQLSDYAARSST
jgi:serine/threonine protein phosphatase PrpC